MPITWSVNGIAGGNSVVGVIAPNGIAAAVYTAPSSPPTPAGVTITAVSAADSSESASAAVTVTCTTNATIAPSSATLPLDASQNLSASFCSAPGAPVTWDVDGVPGGNVALGTLAVTGPSAATYTAPQDLPSPAAVTIHANARPLGGSALSVAASIAIVSRVAVSLAPGSASLSAGQRVTLAPTVTGSSDAAISWLVSGVANGDTSLGRICVAGSNPCVPPAAPLAGSVDFLAPSQTPASNPLIVTAVSHADPSRSAIAAITVAAPQPVGVSIEPAYAFLPPSNGAPSTQQFVATVSGTGNSAVAWSLASAIAGQGCAGAACGSVDANGVYTAPAAASSPNAIAITATSVADPSKSASAMVALTSAPAIEGLSPSSVIASAPQGFALLIQGVNFIAGSGATASAVTINGVLRATTCGSADSCVISLTPADVQTPGTLAIQIRNPGSPPQVSNPAPFVVASFQAAPVVAELTSSNAVAAGQDIVVTEPTTAASSAPLSVEAAGPITGGNNCTLQGSAIPVTRPSSGTSTASICVLGSGLDAGMAYSFGGPDGDATGDVPVAAAAIPGLLPGLIELDLQISAATQPGLRSLWIATLDNDRAVATGILEVK